MGYHRRVTLRCLCEDLTTDWGNVAQQRSFSSLFAVVHSDAPDSSVASALEEVPTSALADHPLVTSFYASFDSDDSGILRESISGLANPLWWKQKVSRWRGAATDDSSLGDKEVWLCAGGIRAAGESRDFYASFMDAIVSGGSTKYLPTNSDRRLQVVEEKIARRDAWLEQARLSAMVCIHECNQTGEARELHIPSPAPAGVEDPLLHISFDVARIDGGGEELIELILTIQPRDFSRPRLLETVVDAVRSVIEPVSDAWRVLPGKDRDQIWSTLISTELLGHARAAADTGVIPQHMSKASLKLGVQAHYTRKTSIVDASVDGDAVRGLCGTWFVPTSSPDKVPVCPSCQSIHERLA